MMFNWGIIGSDLIAEDFIVQLLKTNRSCKIARCSNDKLKERFSFLQFYDTVEELCNDDDIQVVYISTHVYQHQEQIMNVLRHGLHVLVEKPLFLNAKDAEIAYQYASKHKLLLAEANTLFYMPIYKVIEKQIQDGKIGNLKMIRCDFGSLKEENEKAPIFCKERGGGALYDIGIYALSATMMFLDGFINTKACMLQHHYGVDEAWSIIMKNDKQQLASISLSIRSKMDKRFVIAGDKGYIEIVNYPRADSFVFVDSDMNREEFLYGDTKNAILYEIEAIEEMIKSKHHTRSRLELTCNVMQIMDQLRKENM